MSCKCNCAKCVQVAVNFVPTKTAFMLFLYENERNAQVSLFVQY